MKEIVETAAQKTTNKGFHGNEVETWPEPVYTINEV